MPDTDKIREALQRELDGLKQTRDELRVQLKLGAADARDEFDELERKWRRIEEELGRVGGHAQDSLKEATEAARSLLGEVKEGYKRVRNQLKK